MKQRILYLDLLRILACVMIVLMHSQRAGMGIPAWFLSGSSYVTAPGIGLFFMISGALILGSGTKKNHLSRDKWSSFTRLRVYTEA